MTEYKVLIPREEHTLLAFTRDGLPATAVVNTALRHFEPKIVFNFHLSLIITCEHLIGNGMPSREEVRIIDAFGDQLDDGIKFDGVHPNALFLARITWNGERSLVWRVCVPRLADLYLKSLITTTTCVRNFDYLMKQDDAWESAKWFLADHASDQR